VAKFRLCHAPERTQLADLLAQTEQTDQAQAVAIQHIKIHRILPNSCGDDTPASNPGHRDLNPLYLENAGSGRLSNGLERQYFDLRGQSVDGEIAETIAEEGGSW
jgi:hypothetical protein